MNNLQHLFVLDDVYNFIQIWDRRHAYKILQIVSEAFEDLDFDISPENCELLKMDDMWSEKWDTFVEDDDLIAMAAENLPFVEYI